MGIELRLRWTAVFASAALVLGGACSGQPEPLPERQLLFTGASELLLQEDEEATLRVGLFDEAGQPVAGEEVAFELLGAGVTLSGDGRSITDAGGEAAVLVSAGTEDAEVSVRASAERAEALTFRITVEGLRPRLSILPGSFWSVKNGGARATAYASPESELPLRVRLVDQRGRPLEHAQVRFQILTPETTATIDRETVMGWTDDRGEAGAILGTGTTPRDGFVIAAHGPRGAGVFWRVNLLTECPPVGGCPFGQRCEPSIGCVSELACQVGTACPAGHRCESGVCVPIFGDGCLSDFDCGEAFTCAGGRCAAKIPECDPQQSCTEYHQCSGGACEPVPWIHEHSGSWRTHEVFTLEHPSFAQDTTVDLRNVDQYIVTDLGLPGFIEDIVALGAPQYRAAWADELEAALDALGPGLERLEASGSLELGWSGGPTTTLQATPRWETLSYYYRPLCPLPPVDPWPVCARELLNLSTSVDALGVAAWPYQMRYESAGVQIGSRRITVDIDRVASAIADHLAERITPHAQLHTALQNFYDCPAYGTFVADNSWGLLSQASAESICRSLLSAVADDVAARIAAYGDGSNDLVLQGSASVIWPASGEAAQMGQPSHEVTRDGSWSGSMMPGGSVTGGSWYARRDPP